MPLASVVQRALQPLAGTIVLFSVFLFAMVSGAANGWSAPFAGPIHDIAFDAAQVTPDLRAHKRASRAALIGGRPGYVLHPAGEQTALGDNGTREDVILGGATLDVALLPAGPLLDEPHRLTVAALIILLFIGMCATIFTFFRHFRKTLSMPRATHWEKR